MKIKHVLASAKDKKATIQAGEMKKLMGDLSDQKVTLYYQDFEASITYHKSRNGQSWYADTRFPKDKYLPKVGQPIEYDVDLVIFFDAMDHDPDLFANIEEDKQSPIIEFYDEFQPIRDWAEKRGIYKKGDVKTQYLKLLEEVGELSKAILQNDKEEVIDAIGDCVVVLTNLAELASNHFRNTCKTCDGFGGYDEDVAGDGGSRMFQHCEDCYGFTIEDCINSAYEVIAKRKGKMVNGTFVKDK
jgi:hypothetical protein